MAYAVFNFCQSYIAVVPNCNQIYLGVWHDCSPPWQEP